MFITPFLTSFIHLKTIFNAERKEKIEIEKKNIPIQNLVKLSRIVSFEKLLYPKSPQPKPKQNIIILIKIRTVPITISISNAIFKLTQSVRKFLMLLTGFEPASLTSMVNILVHLEVFL